MRATRRISITPAFWTLLLLTGLFAIDSVPAAAAGPVTSHQTESLFVLGTIALLLATTWRARSRALGIVCGVAFLAVAVLVT